MHLENTQFVFAIGSGNELESVHSLEQVLEFLSTVSLRGSESLAMFNHTPLTVSIKVRDGFRQHILFLLEGFWIELDCFRVPFVHLVEGHWSPFG